MLQQNRKIICTGNRLTVVDSAGPLVYDYLAERDIPKEVQLIDGGLAGLDLIRLIDGSHRVIFVDSASGFDQTPEVMVLDLEDVIGMTTCTSPDHSNGLIYLLHVLPEIYQDLLPEVYFVGIQGFPRTELIEKAAETSLHLAMDDS